MMRISAPVALCTLLLCIGGVAAYKMTQHIPVYALFSVGIGNKVSGDPQTSSQSTTVVFVGDVMLARSVETLFDARGTSYPFLGVQEFLNSHTVVYGNFEGVVPEVHRHTKPMTFAFSVDKKIIPSLKDAGFTHLTLANNHANDFGKKELEHTRTLLRDVGIEAYGSPTSIAEQDISYITVGTTRIAVLPLHAVFTYPSITQVRTALSVAEKQSDIQLVSIHWGEEYRNRNTKAQKEYAHALIDLGVDAIIGHHPHVIENIEMYRNAPIFYSLGNFIFDQYWDESVKTGLAVVVRQSESVLRYEIVPVYSAESSPILLKETDRQKVLDALASVSDLSLQDAIRSGVLEVPIDVLAME